MNAFSLYFLSSPLLSPNGGGQNVNRSVEILAVVAVGFDRQNNTFLNFTVNSYLL